MGPSRSARRSGGIQPSGATLTTPSNRPATHTTTALARSSACRYWTGGSPSAATPTLAAWRVRANCPRWSSVTTAVGRRIETAAPLRWACHSSASRSILARCRAHAKSGFGLTAAASVSGTGLPVQAPYTIADDMINRCPMSTTAMASRTRRVTASSSSASATWPDPAVMAEARCTTESAPANNETRSASARSSCLVSTRRSTSTCDTLSTARTVRSS